MIAALENLASWSVAERAGSRREGTLRARQVHGVQTDYIFFSLIRDRDPSLR